MKKPDLVTILAAIQPVESMRNTAMDVSMISNNKNYRFERQYLLDRDAAFLLKQRISYVLLPDYSSPDGRYHISSLYFDDQYNSAFYDKQNGVLTRDKFRARFYNSSMDTIRLECKHKHGEMVHKEGTLIHPEQYQMMCQGDYSFMKYQQDSIFEKFYSAHLLKRMRPVVMIDYDRQAYMHHAGNVRITFDSGLWARLPMSHHPFPILSEENIILEVKYDRFIPSFIAGLLAGVQFTQQLAISKFVMAKLVLQEKHSVPNTIQSHSFKRTVQ